MLLQIGLLILGLGAVLLGANLLVDGASVLAKRLKISDLVIGLTVVAFGTSSPELTVSLYSALSGNTDIALGNVVGSNIFNVLVILGLSALIRPIRVQSSTVFKEIPFALLAAFLILVGANDMWLEKSGANVLSRTDGIFFLGFFIIFMYYTFSLIKGHSPDELHNPVRPRPLWLAIGMVLGGLLLLVLGGRWTVDAAVDIAGALGVSQSVIGLTIVAAGTSLPELATSLVAAYRGNSDIAVGNVVGSNIFNIFFILGLTACVHPLGMGNIDNVDLLVCFGSGLVLQIFAGNHKISRWEGLALVILFIGYTGYLIGK